MHIGFRAWVPRIHANGNIYLSSLIAAYDWEGPVAETGVPRENINHEIDIECNWMPDDPTLGIHSYNSYEMLISEMVDEDCGGLLIGAVQNFGVVVTHEDGFRSEKAQILAIVKYVGCDYIIGHSGNFGLHCNEHADHFEGRYFFCEDHFNILSAREWKFRTPHLMTTEEYMEKVSAKFGCDLVTAKQLSNLKERYNV